MNRPSRANRDYAVVGNAPGVEHLNTILECNPNDPRIVEMRFESVALAFNLVLGIVRSKYEVVEPEPIDELTLVKRLAVRFGESINHDDIDTFLNEQPN